MRHPVQIHRYKSSTDPYLFLDMRVEGGDDMIKGADPDGEKMDPDHQYTVCPGIVTQFM